MAVAGTLEYLISVDSSRLSSGLGNAESKVKGFGNRLTTWATAKGMVLGNLITQAGKATLSFVRDSVRERMDFDKQMSQVAATLGKSMKDINSEIGETETKFGHFEGSLSDFARYMGQNTAFTASQAAEALNYMALAGYDAQKSMNMLPTVLDLAAAGAMDLGRASDMITDTQSALGLSIDQTTVLVDQMAKTASRTNTSVEQLGDAMLTVGGTAKMMKGGTRELSAVLGVLADNGIKGSEGGTALRNVLLSLSAPTSKAQKELKKLGINVFDAAGNMRELPDIMADFNEKTKNMSAEKRTNILSTIFNKRDLKAVEALLGTTADRWEELYNEIADSEGAASEMAETQLDNLSGDVTKFQSALGEAKLSIVEGITPALRRLVQIGTTVTTRLTNAFKSGGLSGAIDEAKKMAWEFVDKLSKSDNPVVSAIGRMINAFKTGFTWENLGNAISEGWEAIKTQAANLAGLVFGRAEDGSVAWPTWDDVKEKAKEVWLNIKAKAKAIGTSLGVLVFGKKADGKVDWPTWNTVKKKAEEIWGEIKAKAKELKGLVFGDAADAGDVFETIKTKWTELRDTIEGGAIEIATYFFGDADPETVARAIHEICNALEAVGVAIVTYNIATTLPKIISNIKSLFTMQLTGSSVALILSGIAAAFTLIYEHWDELEPVLARVGAWLDENIIKPIQNVIDKIRELLGLDQEISQEGADAIASKYNEYMNAASPGEKVSKRVAFEQDLKEQLRNAGYVGPQITKILQNIDEIGAKSPTIDAATQAVSEYIKSLSGAESEVGTLGEAASNVAGDYDINFHINTFGDMPEVPSENVGTHGGRGFAKGLYSVPYDDFYARLHRGEMVLTKSQARRYRDGEKGVDIDSLIPALVGAIREGMNGAQVNSYLDGNDVTRQTNRVTGGLISARRFAPT